MNHTSKVVLAALGVGVAGWLVENLFFNPGYSHHLPRVPILPVYAAGGATIALLEPHLRHLPWQGRALVYAGTLGSLEGIAGELERAEGRRSWDYDGRPVDLAHAAVWGAMGIVVEQAVRGLSK